MNTTTKQDAKRSSLGARVAKELRDRILRFEFPPGARLTEEDLAATFGVSRSPVREALSRLAAQGLVESTPHKGYTVSRFDIQEIKDLYELRMALELYAVGEVAAKKKDHPRLAELAELWADPRVVSNKGAEELSDLDRDFHESITRIYGNQALTDDLSRINERLTVLRLFDFAVPDRFVSTCSQHGAIIERMRAGDAEGARAAMRANIGEGVTNVETKLAEILAKSILTKAKPGHDARHLS